MKLLSSEKTELPEPFRSHKSIGERPDGLPRPATVFGRNTDYLRRGYHWAKVCRDDYSADRKNGMDRETLSVTKPRPVGAGLRLRTISFILVFAGICMTTVVYGQQNVRSLLIPAASRKPAPAFELVAQNGKKMRIPLIVPTHYS